MLFSNIVTCLAVLLSSTHAFTIPEGVVDGVYRVHTQDNIEIHTKIKDLPAPSSLEVKAKRAPVSLNRRTTFFYEAYHCGCGYNMNHANCDSAVEGLKDQLRANTNTWFRTAYSFYVIRGSVIAFACISVKPEGEPFYMESADYYSAALQRITGRCGWYVAGTYSTDYGQRAAPEVPVAWELFSDVGYMNHFPGLNVCAAAKGSNADHC